MIILALRTDKPEAELGIFDDGKKIDYIKWQAHRELAETIHAKIDKILNKSSKSLSDIGGVVCFEGPGSFTGLRIGLSVANALAYANSIPIVAAGGEDWASQGIEKLLAGKNDNVAIPKYGSQPNITPPRK